MGLIRRALDAFRGKPQLPSFGIVPGLGGDRFTADWKVGDLGVCIYPGPWFTTYGEPVVHHPKLDETVRVTGVAIKEGFAVLDLRGFGGSWQECGFRKIDEAGGSLERLEGLVPRKVDGAPRPLVDA